MVDVVALLLTRFGWRICPGCGNDLIIRTSKRCGLSKVVYLKCHVCGWGGKKVVPVQTGTALTECQKEKTCDNGSGDETCAT